MGWIKTHSKKLICSAALVAGGVLLPGLLHIWGLEKHLLIMQFPILLAGFLLPMIWAVSCSAIIPVLCMICWGSPFFLPDLPLILCEMIAYAALANLLYISFRQKVLPSLLLTMLLGRLVMFCAASIYSWLTDSFNAYAYTYSSILTGWPGMLLQVALVPLVVKVVEKWVAPPAQEYSNQ